MKTKKNDILVKNIKTLNVVIKNLSNAHGGSPGESAKISLMTGIKESIEDKDVRSSFVDYCFFNHAITVE